jgi:hypothetical protein
MPHFTFFMMLISDRVMALGQGERRNQVSVLTARRSNAAESPDAVPPQGVHGHGIAGLARPADWL